MLFKSFATFLPFFVLALAGPLPHDARQALPSSRPSLSPSFRSEVLSYMSAGSFPPGFASSIREERGPHISSALANHTVTARQDVPTPSHSVPPEVESLHSEVKALMSNGPIPSDVASSIRVEMKDLLSSEGIARPSRSFAGGARPSHSLSARQEPSASLSAPVLSHSGPAPSELASLRSEMKSIMSELVESGAIPSGLIASLQSAHSHGGSASRFSPSFTISQSAIATPSITSF